MKTYITLITMLAVPSILISQAPTPAATQISNKPASAVTTPQTAPLQSSVTATTASSTTPSLATPSLDKKAITVTNNKDVDLATSQTEVGKVETAHQTEQGLEKVNSNNNDVSNTTLDTNDNDDYDYDIDIEDEEDEDFEFEEPFPQD